MMPTRETALQRAARRTMMLLRRVGEELRIARVGHGMSTRHVARLVGISHTQVLRIERGLAPHVDVELFSRLAAVLGSQLSMSIHPMTAPVRDASHVALIREFQGRLHRSIQWRTEVPMPIPGDLRSADMTIQGEAFDGIVEAETRLDDVQAVERRLRTKQRDLVATRAILLVLDTRHNRAVINDVPELRRQFPVGTRACLAALARGEDPEGTALCWCAPSPTSADQLAGAYRHAVIAIPGTSPRAVAHVSTHFGRPQVRFGTAPCSDSRVQRRSRRVHAEFVTSVCSRYGRPGSTTANVAP
jgi:transcriptional regulator with XRE-family HTH domain